MTSRTDSQNGDYTAIDPRKDPVAFVYQNKEALGRMDPEKAVRFVDMVFRRYALPKYQKINQQRPLDEEEVERLRLQFAARMFDIPYEQETKLKDPKVEYGTAAKAAATVEGAGAGVLGGIKTIAELSQKLDKHLGPIGDVMSYAHGAIGKAAGKGESRAWEDASRVAPSGASAGAAVGHQIPAAIATHGVESVLPAVAKTAPLAARVISGAGRGAAGGATFEASRPGGDPASGAQWGGILGGAFPVLEKLFGLGRIAKAVAPTVAEAVEREGAPAAKAAPTEAKSLGDVAEAAAKSKFGKSFKDLTPAEKTQMPSVMKEEIARQRAQQAATKKAEQAAAKAGREADEVAKRAEKAKVASEKAAKQAAKRSETGAATPVQKQAVAAQAAAENPSIAKTIGGVQEESELERARRGATTKEIPKTAEELKGEAERRLEKEAVQKVPEGVGGKKTRAGGGRPASPAQQAADRERIAAKRELAKGEEFGSALEKHAQSLAGRHTEGSIGLMHIPELEEAMKEFPNGELFLKGFQKLRKAGRITDEIYLHEMKEWLLTQFEKPAAD
jgi:hypothetical protein